MTFLGPLRGLLGTLLFVVSMFVAVVPLVIMALFKLLLPVRWRPALMPWLDAIANAWISFNGWHQRWLTDTVVKAEGDLDLSRQEQYLLVANHQSWVDILVLLRAFHGRIPYVKFFLKQGLLWVPLLGIGCWALGFPFMRRHTREQIRRNPSLASKDIEETRRACEIYRHNPMTLINFIEGTRFTPAKYAQQGSEYRHLLKPRAGGLAFALTAMDGQLRRLLDVTIAYPEGRPSYWEYVCGRVGEVRIHVRQRDIGPELLGDYANDDAFRASFQEWVNTLWQEKDARMAKLLSDAPDI